MDKTRSFYERHNCFVVVGRSKETAEYAKALGGAYDFRRYVDYGIWSEYSADDYKHVSFVYCFMRCKKPIRFDVVAKRFKGCYVTRLNVGNPSGVGERFFCKHNVSYDNIVEEIIDRTHGTCSDTLTDIDEYGIIFDDAYNVLKEKK